MAKAIPKLNFYLASPKAKNETAIVLFIGHNSNRVKHNTPISLNPKFWDKNKQRIKNNYSQYLRLNRLLDNMYNTAQTYFIECAERIEKPNFDHLKKKLPKNIDNVEPENFFVDCYNKFVIAKEPIVKSGTIQTYNNALAHFKSIEKHYNHRLSFNNIDYSFEEHLQHYCFTRNSFLNATYNKLLKTLKVFLQWSTDKNYNENEIYRKFKRFPEVENDLIVLNESELKIIEELELDNYLENYRNLFLIECYTGLRYSDLKHIKKENVKNDYLHVTQTKTSTPIKIPILHNISNLIIEQTFKKVPSNQKFNNALKEIGELAKLDEEIEMVKISGSARTNVKVIKKDVISTHTGRRTFCTLALKKGMTPHEIMKITGHKKIEVFNKYLRITHTDLQTSMNKAFN